MRLSRITLIVFLVEYEVHQYASLRPGYKAVLECEFDLRNVQKWGRALGLHKIRLSLSWRTIEEADLSAATKCLCRTVQNMVDRNEARPPLKADFEALTSALRTDLKTLMPQTKDLHLDVFTVLPWILCAKTVASLDVRSSGCSHD